MATGKDKHEDDQLNGIAERDVQQSANCVAKTARDAFSCLAKQSGEGDNSNSVHRKHYAGRQVGKVDGDADRNKYQQDIDIAGQENLLESNEKVDYEVVLLSWLLFCLARWHCLGCLIRPRIWSRARNACRTIWDRLARCRGLPRLRQRRTMSFSSRPCSDTVWELESAPPQER